MVEANLVPDLLRALANLERAIYELERRRVPAIGGGGGLEDPIIFRTPQDSDPPFETLAWFTANGDGNSPFGTSDLVLGYEDTGNEPYGGPYVENVAYGADSAASGAFIDMEPIRTAGDCDTLVSRRSDEDGNGGLFFDTDNVDWANTVTGGRTTFGGVLVSVEEIIFHAGNYQAVGQVYIGLETELSHIDPPEGPRGIFEVRIGTREQFLMHLDYGFTGDSDHTLLSFGTGPPVWGQPSGAAAIAFGIFDQGDTPATQAAAVDVSAESAAVQSFYADLRAYGWFAA